MWLIECTPPSDYYMHTDATDSTMFSLAPMLPMFDVRIGLTIVISLYLVDALRRNLPQILITYVGVAVKVVKGTGQRSRS